MLNKVIEKYILQKIGEYTEIIVSKDIFIQAVTEINSLGYKIADVCWFGHLKISDIGKNIDIIFKGGPTDKNNINYFWAETDFCKEFKNDDLSENIDQVINYFNEFVSNDKHDLYPAISLRILEKK